MKHQTCQKRQFPIILAMCFWASPYVYGGESEAPAPPPAPTKETPSKHRLVETENKISDEDAKKIANQIRKDQDKEKATEEARKLEEERLAIIEMQKEERHRELLAERLDQVKALSEKADAAWSEKRKRLALEYYAIISNSKAAGAEQLITTARNRMVEAEKEAAKRLADAETEYDQGDYVKSLEALKSLMAEYPRTAVAHKADRLVAGLRGRPETAGQMYLSEGELAENYGQWAEAAAIYRKLSADPRFTGSITAVTARRRLAAMSADPDKQGEIQAAAEAEKQKAAARLLKDAENFRRNGMTAKAKERWKELLERYPDSPEAAQAKKFLDGTP
jgi:TolA-binding protein